MLLTQPPVTKLTVGPTFPSNEVVKVEGLQGIRLDEVIKRIKEKHKGWIQLYPWRLDYFLICLCNEG